MNSEISNFLNNLPGSANLNGSQDNVTNAKIIYDQLKTFLNKESKKDKTMVLEFVEDNLPDIPLKSLTELETSAPVFKIGAFAIKEIDLLKSKLTNACGELEELRQLHSKKTKIEETKEVEKIETFSADEIANFKPRGEVRIVSENSYRGYGTLMHPKDAITRNEYRPTAPSYSNAIDAHCISTSPSYSSMT